MYVNVYIYSVNVYSYYSIRLHYHHFAPSKQRLKISSSLCTLMPVLNVLHIFINCMQKLVNDFGINLSAASWAWHSHEFLAHYSTLLHWTIRKPIHLRYSHWQTRAIRHLKYLASAKGSNFFKVLHCFRGWV